MYTRHFSSLQVTPIPPVLRECSHLTQSASEGTHSGASSCTGSRRGSNQLMTMGSLRDEAEKALYLEQQVLSLTRDKKQLMTHLHWLSRQREEQSSIDSIGKRLEKGAKKLSLEEGNGFDSHLAGSTNHGACLARGQRFEYFSRSASVDNAANGEYLYTEGGLKEIGKMPDKEKAIKLHTVNEKELLERMKRLKATMLAVKQIVTKNNETCDSIFQLSFQNFRHPNEPRSYSMWSSCDEERIMSSPPLVKSQESMNYLMNTGYRSLENYPNEQIGGKDAFHPCHSSLFKKKSSISSPELFLGEKYKLNDLMMNSVSSELGNKDSSCLSRSLSDQDSNYRSRMGSCFGNLSLGKGAAKPVFSTLTSAEDLENDQCSTRVIHDVSHPIHFSSLGQMIRQPENSPNEESNRLVLASSSFPCRTFYSENLIS